MMMAVSDTYHGANLDTAVSKIVFCIFDMDGLLLDTEAIYHRVTNEIMQRYGQSYAYDLKYRMMGRRALDAAQMLIELTGIPMTPEEYLLEREPRQNELFAGCQILPGVERLVRHLKRHRIPIAVATSSCGVSFDAKTRHHQDFFALFDAIIMGDNIQVKAGKPAPDIFLHAAHVLSEIHNTGIETNRCLVFEDSVIGIKAARAANMFAVMVPDPELPKEETRLAHQVLQSMSDFCPEHWGLPPFQTQ